MSTRTVSAVFDDAVVANRVVETLREKGLPPDAISILMASDTAEGLYPGDRQNIEEGTGWGAAFGALMASAVMISVLPGAAPFFVAGPIGALLTAAASGAVGGGLLGALTGLGVPREQAQVYEQRLQEGGVAVAVETGTEDEAQLAAGVISNLATPQNAITLVVTKPRP